MKLGTKETSWIGKKRTFEFFVGYSNWSEKLRLNSMSDLQLKNLLDQIDNYKTYPVKNKIIFKFKLLNEARKLNSDLLVKEYYDFLDNMKNSHFWIEKASDSKMGIHENSFLAPQGFSLAHNENEKLIAKVNRPPDIKRAQKNISRIFQELIQYTKGTAAYPNTFSKISKKEGELFKAISQIHYEITDNIDHWMNYPSNPRSYSHHPKFLGDTLIFEVKTLPIVRTVNTKEIARKIHSKYPIEVMEYLNAYIDKFHGQSTHFLELNYFDNGRGVSQNFCNFKPEYQYKNLKDTITSNGSTRNSVGAGKGYEKAIMAACRQHGLFYIQSGNEIVSSSFNTGKVLQHRYSEDNFGGTFISIVLPAVA